MKATEPAASAPSPAEAGLNAYRDQLGPFVTATETTRMPMIFLGVGESDEQIIYANKSFLLLTGYSREELLGQKISLLLADKDDVRLTSEILLNVPSIGNNGFHVLCKRKNRETVPVAVFCAPVRDSKGNILQYFASFVDLNDQFASLGRKTVEKPVYQNMPGFIVMSQGPDHEITFANGTFRDIVGRRRLEGRKLVSALPEVVEGGMLADIEKVYRTGTPFSARDFRVDLKKGLNGKPSTHYVDFVYVPIRDEHGAITGLFCGGQDVTREVVASRELALAQARLIHLSRVSAMDTMGSTLAHELNQPLAIIAGYAQGCNRLLADDDSISPQIREGLRGIGEAALRAGQIIRRLRDMTKRSTASCEDFELTEAQHEAIELVRIAGCEGATIIETKGAGSTVFADRVQIQQVIVNLVKNACEAAAVGHGNREVMVATELKGEQVILTVSDSGEGVTDSAASTLFDWNDSDKPDGMGIGLAISRTIIENQSGRIWLDDTSANGSRFCFSLPSVSSRVPAQASAASTAQR